MQFFLDAALVEAVSPIEDLCYPPKKVMLFDLDSAHDAEEDCE